MLKTRMDGLVMAWAALTVMTAIIVVPAWILSLVLPISFGYAVLVAAASQLMTYTLNTVLPRK